MRKLYKIYFILVIAVLVLIPSTIALAGSSAKTLGELKKELQTLQNKKASNQSNKQKTKNQINNAKDSIANKQGQIITNQETIESAKRESEKLTQEIEDGKGELEKLLLSYQMLKNDNTYLEYLFAADSYADLIYRYAIVEEIMNYETDKINEWNDKIDYNDKLQKDLAKREIELNNQIDSLTVDISNLGDKLAELDDMALDIDADIKSIKDSISYYQSIGCKDNQTLADCLRIAGDTKFSRPLNSGRISSSFGYRKDPITGKAKKFHSGTDIAIGEGSKVYAIANGTVVKKWDKSSCGGNALFIQHLVNGKKYTSAYLHLWSFNVKIGDKVTSQTVIAYSGGGKHTAKKYGGYDSCTTGAHLHLSLATGWYGSDYLSYDSFRSHLINPKTNVPLPNSWSSRY